MTDNEALRILGDTALCSPLGQAAFVGIGAIKKLQQYREIGTVEECREAREKQRAKKPLQGEPYTWIDSVRVKGRYRDVRKTSYSHVCPNCGKNVATDMSCCKYCGQAIDWSETVWTTSTPE